MANLSKNGMGIDTLPANALDVYNIGADCAGRQQFRTAVP